MGLLGKDKGSEKKHAAKQVEKKPERKQTFRGGIASGVADDLIKQLAPKDGMLHVAMFNCFGSLGATQGISADAKFNEQADLILTAIQQAGREVADVKFDGQYGVGLTGSGISYHVMVTYR